MTVKTSAIAEMETDESYQQFEAQVWDRVKAVAEPVFTTNAGEGVLWDAYLAGIPEDRRQHYNCNCCRRFVQRYGGLVTIDKRTGETTPVLWGGEVAPFFATSCSRMHRVVGRAQVTGVFLQRGEVWGTPTTGDWTHLSGVCKRTSCEDKVLTADQVVAQRKEEFGMLRRGLAEYPKDAVDQALRVLRADTLSRGEKTLGVAEWLGNLQERLSALDKRERHLGDNLVWLAVATAPPGYAHVKTTMIATLLDDVKAGMDYDSISRRWSEKMHPLQYQRPTAPPSEGAVKQAEKLVETLGLRRSFERRFATLDDVLVKLWVPATQAVEEPTRPGGLFDHLRTRTKGVKVKEVELPPVKVTWDKFLRTVLPTALEVEVYCPARGPYYGLVTAVDPEAPAIIQWDGLEGMPRNPVSWYFYASGSQATRWNLDAGWNKVTAVFDAPHRWQAPDKFRHQGNNVHFAVEGCHESDSAELALFPEILKAEMHGVRSVVEAHSRAGKITAGDGGNANGIAFQAKSGTSVSLRVKTESGTATYVVDRMD